MFNGGHTSLSFGSFGPAGRTRTHLGQLEAGVHLGPVQASDRIPKFKTKFSLGMFMLTFLNPMSYLGRARVQASVSKIGPSYLNYTIQIYNQQIYKQNLLQEWDWTMPINTSPIQVAYLTHGPIF